MIAALDLEFVLRAGRHRHGLAPVKIKDRPAACCFHDELAVRNARLKLHTAQRDRLAGKGDKQRIVLPLPDDSELDGRVDLTCNPANIEKFTGSIGVPVPSTYLSIRDDDGNEVPLGQPGEICAKGPQVMAGYWNRPDETARVMTADGYFRTGDIGVMDENGYTKIVDRKKDMILVSGFNVYPNELEEVIASHPGVLECAVIGVPDAKTGEAVKAFVVRKDPALTAEDIIKFCGTQLANYKVPKLIEFRTDLPKTNVGKILRRELRDEKKAAA